MAVDLGPLASIPIGEGRTFILDGHLVAVFRTRNGEVFATQAECPHRGGPLADGILGAGQVICPLHARTFDLATGEARGHDCDALRTYPVAVAGTGHLLLTVPDDAADAPGALGRERP